MRLETASLAVWWATGAMAEVEPRAATSSSPCAPVARTSSSYLNAYPSATSVPMAPSVALECLNSIPVDTQRDVELIDYMVPYMQFQSTLEFLKTPTAEYLMPGADVLGGMATIREKLVNGTYSSQYQFIRELESIFVRAHDGHFWYNPALYKIFSFERPYSLLSISTDGVTSPKVYFEIDIIEYVSGARSNYSDIVSIDGVPIVYAVEVKAYSSPFQDPDALYNTVFQTPAFYVSGLGNKFITGYETLPDNSTYTFSNGSSITLNNHAWLLKSFQGISSGEDLHNRYEVPSSTSAGAQKRAAVTSTAVGAAKPKTFVGYPTPIIQNTGGWLSGYFLNDTNYKDTAVLSVWAFDTAGSNNNTADALEIRAVLQKFFKECETTGKNKLVIDLQGNDGGQLINGFELFRQLFPAIPITYPISGRATPRLDEYGQALGIYGVEGGYFVDASGDNLTEWKDLFGPQVVTGANFTNLFTWDFNNANNFGFSPNGYGRNTDTSGSPFAAENIVIITDGTCTSTCTTFTGIAARHAGVRTIAYGGRPMNQPMQAMGGVKGGTAASWNNTRTYAIETYVANGKIDTGSNALNVSQPPLLPAMGSDYNLNWRNAHTNWSDPTPAQFIYEAANCKQYFTTKMMVSITAQWENAVDIAWYGAKCVSGSTTNSDDTIGNSTVPFSTAVKADWNFYVDGPGAVNPNTTATATTGSGSGTASPTASASGGSTTTTAPANAAGVVQVSAMAGLISLAAAVFLL